MHDCKLIHNMALTDNNLCMNRPLKPPTRQKEKKNFFLNIGFLEQLFYLISDEVMCYSINVK